VNISARTNASSRDARDRFEKAILQSVTAHPLMAPALRGCQTPQAFCLKESNRPAALLLLDRHHICCSAGSACGRGPQEASHVLRAMNSSGGGARRSPALLAWPV